MNKTLKRVLSVGLCAGMGASTLALSACASLDAETRPLQLATAALDGNFNPFFYTSLTDGNMVGMTQLPLVTGDADGNLVCGEDWATVALDKKTTMYDANGNVMTEDGDMNGSTVYEFVIKNGIKYSDGVDLTIKDVLFNLYVYLDPAYTGSTTLYSVDIKGLNAYRMQNKNAPDGDLADTDASFRGDAQTKIDNIVDWSDGKPNAVTPSDDDLNTIKRLFKDEITRDWTAVEASWSETYKYTHRFTQAWQAYLFQEGIISVQTRQESNGAYSEIYDDTNGNGKKDDGELYYTTLDPNQSEPDKGKVESQHIIDEINSYVNDNIASYKAEHNVSDEEATLALQRDCCIDMVYNTYTMKANIGRVLMYWTTGSEVLQSFIGDARETWYESLKENNGGELAVKSISGIETYRTTNFNGKDLGSEHDVLKVTINGIDPKAPYNFAFSVAPMHYYSGTYKDVDYVATADGKENFGVAMGEKSFYDTVVQASEKNGLPVGAGAYKASSSDGNSVNKSSFYNGGLVYFERNEHFTTVGSGINNAKLRRVTYKVMNDDQIVSALKTGEIDYGEPNATPDNQNEVNSIKNLQSGTYKTGGYGYIGVNPKFVPDLAVRQAIMKAMDVNLIIKNYYGSSLSEQIYRPESTTSWAYPQNAKEDEDIAYTTVDSEIEELVRGAGYTKGDDGIYAKGNTRLEYTFTIAGETTDHPAYAMFLDAAERLNKIGFKINVGPNIQALRLMNSGSLAVWAAAYSSASDPDLYQVYHKDSKATSVNSWNYSGIMNTNKFPLEKSIVEELSDKIDAARETLDQAKRKSTYEECFDLIMDLAVILPTYQRNDLYVFNKKVIEAKSLNLGKTCSWRMGPISNIWEVDYV